MSNHYAKILRVNLTDAERKLWRHLRNRNLGGYKFKRQFPVWPYILDFACHDLLLAIEVDGGQHSENDADIKRMAWLAKEGWRVMRFWNNEVLGQTEVVIEKILNELNCLNSAKEIPSP